MNNLPENLKTNKDITEEVNSLIQENREQPIRPSRLKEDLKHLEALGIVEHSGAEAKGIGDAFGNFRLKFNEALELYFEKILEEGLYESTISQICSMAIPIPGVDNLAGKALLTFLEKCGCKEVTIRDFLKKCAPQLLEKIEAKKQATELTIQQILSEISPTIRIGQIIALLNTYESELTVEALLLQLQTQEENPNNIQNSVQTKIEEIIDENNKPTPQKENSTPENTDSHKESKEPVTIHQVANYAKSMAKDILEKYKNQLNALPQVKTHITTISLLLDVIEPRSIYHCDKYIEDLKLFQETMKLNLCMIIANYHGMVSPKHITMAKRFVLWVSGEDFNTAKVDDKVDLGSNDYEIMEKTGKFTCIINGHEKVLQYQF